MPSFALLSNMAKEFYRKKFSTFLLEKELIQRKETTW